MTRSVTRTWHLIAVVMFMALSSPSLAMVGTDATENVAVTTATHNGVQEAEDNVGFPQLDTSTYASQIFWLAIAFVSLYILMAYLALPRVTSTLDRRKQVKETDLHAAEKANSEAQDLQKAYTASLKEAQGDVHIKMHKTEDDIANLITARTAQFAEEARTRIETAEKNIAKAKTDAMSSLSEVAAEIAADIANQIGGGSASKVDAQKVITSLAGKG